MSDSTVLVDKYRRAANARANDNAYQGLAIHALPGLHAFVAQKAVEHFAPGSRVVDLAAGSGAMCARVGDLGYVPTAVDYVAENFKAASVPFVRADLNTAFSTLFDAPFDAIIASEIIEHLENPRHFARECFALLRDGGRMILTTPNLESPGSKASFIRSGQHLWFSDKDYAVEGHITPISRWQIGKSFSEAGFAFRWTGSFGAVDSLVKGSPRLKLLAALLSRLSAVDAALTGEIFAAVLEKPPRQQPLASA